MLKEIIAKLKSCIGNKSSSSDINATKESEQIKKTKLDEEKKTQV